MSQFDETKPPTILLAEDEPAVRRLAGFVLESQGFTVLRAGSGREALEASDAHPGAIDLLVTDLMMPEMSGEQLADQLSRRRPGIRVLFLSGYDQGVMLEHGAHAAAAFLQKPFTPSTLTSKVRELLGPA
jgi:CheY-like chemotaxis protein